MHEPVGQVQFVVFEKINKCLFIPSCTRKITCDYVLIIYMEKYEMAHHNYAKQSARIKCKNNLFKPCVRSKQPRTIKTIICNDIFTSLRRKKSPSKQFKELFSLCPNHF